MGMIGWWISTYPMWQMRGNSLLKAGLLVGAMIASVLFYILEMWVLKSEELEFMRGMMQRKKRG
jgi:hypothetical protein